MNEKQLELLNELSSAFEVNLRISFWSKQVVDNIWGTVIQQAQPNSYNVKINIDGDNFDMDFDGDDVCFTYFFKDDEDYSQVVYPIEEVTADLIINIVQEVCVTKK